jgi:hypothetical protein
MPNPIPMIDVPEVGEGAYNHDRPISSLIHHQLIHLSAAEHCLPAEKQTGINIARLHTERQAAEYIQKVTALLHPEGIEKKKSSRGKNTARKSRSSAKKTSGKSTRSRKTAKRGR